MTVMQARLANAWCDSWKRIILLAACCTCLAIQTTNGQGCNCATDCVANCAAGSYFNSSVCVNCPAGQYCQGGSSPAMDCPAGTFVAAVNSASVGDCQDCSAGYTSMAGSSACTICLAGTFCPNAGTANPSNCVPGQFSGVGATSCTDCPIGSYCLATSGVTPVACDPGYYTSSERQTSCTVCLAGYECPSRTAPVPCSAGKYSSEGDGICTSCSAGQYSGSPASTTCRACPEGNACPTTGVSVPTPCSTGYIAAEGASSCTQCANDKVPDINQAICESCPAGKQCTNPASSPVDCISGTYALLGDGSCTPCPAGSYCPDVASSPISCGTDKYSAQGSISCTLCPAGYSCTTTAATICAAGSFSTAGSTTCSACSAGKFCPEGASAEIACVAGFYSAASAGSCTACSAGSKCTLTTETACDAGQYSPAQSTTCTDCPAGYQCTSTDQVPVVCTSGTYNLQASTTVCQVCPGGYSCDSTTAVPVICDTGYQSANGSTFCSPCPAGYACPSSTDPTRNEQCLPGSFSEQIDTICTDCPVGSACPDERYNSEALCSTGTYSLGNATVCTTCPAGSICPNIDGTGIEECVAGSYATAGSTSCTSCPRGHACPYTNSSQPITCTEGSYAIGGAVECTVCPVGYACPSKTSDVVKQCDAGTYSVGGQRSCTECPAGSECPSTTTNQTDACTPGSYSLGVQTQCSQCEEGDYCEFTTQSGKRCEEGYYSAASSTICTACEAGYYCYSPRASLKTECEPGTYSATGYTACEPCDYGYTCAMGSVSQAPAADICDKGGYCDGKIFYACDAGTYNANNGSTSSVECVPCRAGFYCEGPAQVDDSAFLCPTGHFCPEGTTSPSQHPCPGGTYSNDTGLDEETDCTLCPDSNYCPTGSSEPTTCTAGFWCLSGQVSGEQHPCNGGYYGPTTGYNSSDECTICPSGHYCPEGVAGAGLTEPVPCPSGTYNPASGSTEDLNCHQCLRGFACPETNMSDSTVYPCQEGYYCPLGTREVDQFPCQPGTLGNTTDLTSADDCEVCPLGYICEWATTGFHGLNPPDFCAIGHYCPEQTTSPTQYPCPAGSYTDQSNLYEAAQCTPCTPGYYCEGGGSTTSGECPVGYYCPSGTKLREEYGCPNGTFNDEPKLTAEWECKNCTQGHHCEFAVTGPTKCIERTYMPYGVTEAAAFGDDYSVMIGGTAAKSQPDCLTCIGGAYCLEGQVDPIPCGKGNYSPPESIACTACIAGHYCDNETTSKDEMLTNKRCPAGKLCPASLTDVSLAPDCTTGRYCPEATLEEINCPVGTLRETVGAGDVTDCAPCTAGYFCLEESSVVNGACTEGYYCPTNLVNPYGNDPPFIGSYGAEMSKCPEGTYTNVIATPDLASCLQCPGGYYCGLATANPDICPKGYYCVPGSEKPEPCPAGRYGNRTLLTSADECTPCDPGKYCDAPGLLDIRGLCDPGYLCYSGASTSAPVDGVTGELCIAGGYCTAGSFEAKACPAGTYSNVTGAVNKFDCTDCDAGYYCSSVAGGEPTGPCYAGFYCTGAAKVPTQNFAEPGYFSTSGSAAQTECGVGTYAPNYNMSECLPCPEGYFCQNNRMSTKSICPTGQYCPESNVVPFNCPPGTFSNQSLMIHIDNCTDCPAGKYCENRGLTEPTGDCKVGHICYGNALSDDPVFNNDTSSGLTIMLYGDQCHEGYYCPEGTAVMIECPAGYYREFKSGVSEADCVPCDPGKFCNVTAQTTFTGDCQAGYYCTGAATTPTPIDNITGNICPRHYYCPTGTDIPKACLDGYHANVTGMFECVLCVAGYLCRSETAPEICAQGRYCVASTELIPNILGEPCPISTYGASEGLEAEAYCTNCDGGHYCNAEGQTNTTGKTSGGYWAQSGSTTPAPDNEDSDILGLCPKGYYCPEGSVAAIPCPAGTYGYSIRYSALTDCLSCDAGKYCPHQNQTEAVDDCNAGYYCSGGSIEAEPVAQSWGDECPTGYYCPTGSSNPIACEAGTFTDQTRQSVCLTCPDGFYCPANTTNPIDCPTGHVCRAGQQSAHVNPCPLGTYNNLTTRFQDAECIACPPGYYCDALGLAEPTGLCEPGWFCISGAIFDQPQDAVQGGRCTAGNYCPQGNSAETACDPGEFCPNDGLSTPAGLCSPSYYCTLSSTTNAPVGQTFGDECPTGKYCPEGSEIGENCPPGTYLNHKAAQALFDCVICTQGKYCEGYGNTIVTGDCAAGYWCPSGMNTSNPVEYTCSQGHYCPVGSHQEIRCVSGEYQDETGQPTCKTCPAGYYCDNTVDPVVLYNSTECPAGYYCPAGTEYSSQYKCPVGTYSGNPGLTDISQCLFCPGGYYCDQEAQTTFTLLCNAGYYCRLGAESGTPNQGIDADECPAGYYCPIQSSDPQKCHLGTYSSAVRLTSASECLDCPAGYFCSELNMTTVSGQCDTGYVCPNGSWSPTQIDCPAGYYCGVGTSDPALTPCPVGTFSNQTNLQLVSKCLPCTQGYYCDAPGLTEPTGPCSPGYYCPEGSTVRQPTAYFCIIAHYCPEGSAEPVPCANYTEVNHTHAAECNICPAGYYCFANGLAIICPIGYYCPQGTGLNWQSCPRGTFSATPGLDEVGQCLPCTPGQYCGAEHLSAPTDSCGEGYYCITGVDMEFPDNVTNTGEGAICPVGHHCPVGSITPLACVNGTYSAQEGASACTTCPEGYYCLDETGDYVDTPCDVGHYCPAGTGLRYQYPCPPGTFNNQTHGSSLDNCHTCTPGWYCDISGLSEPTGLCSGSFYCDGGSTSQAPSGSGGNNCIESFFCPEGSPAMSPCTAGNFCGATHLSSPTGPCADGYYCTSSASVANPEDGVTGNICPRGSYCPEGTVTPIQCAPGTFLNSTGNYDSAHCIACLAGWYCAGSGNEVPDGLCTQGYYCPSGQSTATPASLTCTLGHYCPTGSSAPLRCPSGTYQDETGQWECKECPSGYYCDNVIDPVVLYNNTACPTGYYCPANTATAYQFPCPTGTFNNVTHRVADSDCQQCLGREFCSQVGLSEPEDLCDPGFFCAIGSNSRTPAMGSNADTCPVGHYCPQGTESPQSCPAGTYNPQTGKKSVAECTDCDGGYFCPNYNMIAIGTECDAGYYCPSKADVATYIICPAGSYCSAGSVSPMGCPIGTFSNQTGLTRETECTACHPGYYCPNSGQTESIDLCWGGYYCPERQSQPNLYPCPIGMKCANGSSTYQPCTNGYYAPSAAMADCIICPAGYYCLTVIPATASLNAQECPAGYYCPPGTGLDWTSCPTGTYSSATKLNDTTQCTQCDGGMYCSGPHLTEPTGNCAAGYYCSSGVDVQMPNGAHTGVGGICPLGHYCIEASTIPAPCIAGTYNDMLGQSSCKACPAGHYCEAAAEEYNSTVCPIGHYCQEGTPVATQDKCPPGTYNPVSGATSLNDCLQCPGGKYCAGEANSAVTDDCSPGWFCSGGSDSPDTTTHGGECQPGSYCPAGSASPISCPAGEYCQTAGLDAPTGFCAMAYFCVLDASVPNPTDATTGNICPAGYFCGNATSVPSSCSPGTFGPSTGSIDVSDCLPCTAGMYCEVYNLTAPTGNCRAGYYCPQGETIPDRLPCTAGYYCPEGSETPVICPSGQYQDGTGEATCKPCPDGYYCDNTGGPVVLGPAVKCPNGYYCPEGTTVSTEFPCPIGTYNDLLGVNTSTDCTACSAGSYCDSVGLSAPTALCSSGYFCKTSAETATPNQPPDADVCPQGYFCEEGTINPVACPSGTFGGTTGLVIVTECTQCTAGFYCETPGLDAVEGPCEAGYYCETGSNSRTMTLCPEGGYCVQGSDMPALCPEGTFGATTGLVNESQCSSCLPSDYCESQGQNTTTGPCDAGYFCPGRQNTSRPADYPCPIGHYCPIGSPEPYPCANGTFMNTTHGTECYICPAGWYCVNGDDKTICPLGYYCPEGTGFNWRQCPLGTYNNETGLTQESECKPCPGGYYCGTHGTIEPNGLCAEGYYCTYGVDRPQPSCATPEPSGLCTIADSHTGVGGVCTDGFFCPEGSTQMTACGAGSYSNDTLLRSCHTCPAGYYCLVGAVTYLDTPCPIGYYCPQGTSTIYENACPPGTFYNQTMATQLSDCIPCLPGQYCSTPGLAEPTGPCNADYYCTLGSTTATPILGSEGGPCERGFYCPQGSSTPTQCDPGTYCEINLLDSPTGNCSAGYYCTLEAWDPTPTDNVTGNECPMGHYCPAGSSAPLPCPAGSYLNVTGQDELVDCLDCIGGYYCPGTGNVEPAGPCNPGYTCPAGQSEIAPAAFSCPIGHYCPLASPSPLQCDDGYYQDETTQSSCILCERGHFCDNTGPIVTLGAGTTCHVGYSCPEGTKYPTDFPCPEGTFNNLTGLWNESSCTLCLGGYACPVPGMSDMDPTYLCEAGFFCKQGSRTTTPQQGPAADVCPVGHFCPLGTSEPEPCPKGSYSNGDGLEADIDCILCTTGWFCDAVRLTAPAGMCSEGFYCEIGSNNSQHLICPVGNYCPAGSSIPTPCPAGTYSNTEGLTDESNCTDCDPGTYCNDTGLSAVVGDCDAGFYCPGRNSVPNPPATPCDIGLHCPTGAGAPVPCVPGTFTNLTHQASCITCPPTFYCVPEQVVAGVSTSGHTLCPAGFYCRSGTGMDWQACPPGTFSNVEGQDDVADCQACTPGMYCDVTNLTSPVGSCAAGYFCTEGVDTPTPDGSTNTGTGDTCPIGAFCELGTILPEPCPAGTYQTQTGQSVCVTCVPGYYCTDNSTDYTDKPCPSGHYCPHGTVSSTEHKCPMGTFNNHTGALNISFCLPCLPGMYCETMGLSEPTGLCSPGWFCASGSYLLQPTDPEGGKCVAGTYCPEGSAYPLGCEPGQYCNTDTLASPAGNCSEGFFCTENSTTSQPTGAGGDRCPAGFFCVSGSSALQNVCNQLLPQF